MGYVFGLECFEIVDFTLCPQHCSTNVLVCQIETALGVAKSTPPGLLED
jgi:hypothetical protein